MNRWLQVGVALLASAASAGWALVLHWQPCRGFMLDASVLTGFTSGSFSDACLRRMDSSLPFPFPPEPAELTTQAASFGTVAMVFAAFAGLVLALGLQVEGWLRALVALPALLTGLMAVVSAWAAADPGRDPNASLPLWLWGSAELAAVLAVAALASDRHRHTGLSRRTFWVVVVVVWSTTMFGFGHQVSDYLLMTTFSEVDWDNPPGTGALTVVGLLVGAVLALVQRGRRPSRAAPVEGPARPRTAVGGRTLAG